MTDLVEQLERGLHADAGGHLDRERLGAIRRAGARRRVRRRAAAAGAAALAVAVLAGGPLLVLGGGDEATVPAPAAPTPTSAEDPAPPRIQASPDLPADLAALQERILAEVPGAVRSSPTQVDLPDPREVDPDLEPPASGYQDPPGPEIGLGVPAWSTPTWFPPGAFPTWLSDGWADFADEAAASPDPVVRGLGRTAVRARAGELLLSCERGRDGGCGLQLLQRTGGTLRVDRATRGRAWLNGGDPELVEVFDTNLEPGGGAPALVLGAVARDDVDEVAFFGEDERKIAGRFDDTLVPGTTIFWAEVPGDLAGLVVTTRDGLTLE